MPHQNVAFWVRMHPNRSSGTGILHMISGSILASSIHSLTRDSKTGRPLGILPAMVLGYILTPLTSSDFVFVPWFSTDVSSVVAGTIASWFSGSFWIQLGISEFAQHESVHHCCAENVSMHCGIYSGQRPLSHSPTSFSRCTLQIAPI